jgi:PAS domain S-box-containing protein
VTDSINQRVAIEQALLAAIVESSDDGIISTDLSGVIGTWNGGAERLYGYSAQEALGQPITILIPRERANEELAILERIRLGERVEHYETLRRCKDGKVVDVSLTVSPIKNAEGIIVGASKIARDISRRKRDAERLETLHRIARSLSSDLDLERIVQAVTDTATELSGARYGAFFYNVTHRGGEAYLLYTLSGAPREAFEKFGLPRATPIFQPTFHGTDIVRSDDIRQDPRYGRNPPHHGMPKGHLPVVSYLAVPVISRSGEVIGGLFFGHDEPGVFTQDTEDIVSGIAAHAAIAIDNARLFSTLQEEMRSKELLLTEFQHRMRNTLATVQAIASQTLRHGPQEEQLAFQARLRALADVHTLLTAQSWHRARLSDLVRHAIAPFPPERFQTDGPEAYLDSTRSMLLTLALHELATNAVKYGALSQAGGTVTIIWHSDGQRVSLCWRETDGPPVAPPSRKGFGSALIEHATDGTARLEFASTGVVCVMDMPSAPQLSASTPATLNEPAS